MFFAVPLLLLILCCAAGYPVIRAFGNGLSPDSRVAVLPLAGAAVTAFALQMVHIFQPLDRNGVMLALIPAGVGAVMLAKQRPQRLQFAAAGMLAAALACALAPFWQLREPTSFGIINNDAFFYSAADYLVQHTAYIDPASPSLLVNAASGIRRFGINYLSTTAQVLTGLRTSETIHLTGAFGLLLSMCSGYLLARGLGASWRAAAVAGLIVGLNHWVFRLYIEAVLAFLFGLAFLLGCLWACTLRSDNAVSSGNRIGLGATMLVGLTVFYFDLLPIFTVLAIALAIGGLLFRQRLGFPVAALMILAIMPVAVLQQAFSHFLRVSSSPGPGKHLQLENTGRTLLHLTGMMDVYDYMYWPGSVTVLHVAGAVAAAALVALAARRLLTRPLAAVSLLTVVAPLLLLWAMLEYQGRSYHGHRALTLAAACAIPAFAALLSGGAARRLRTALAAVVLLGVVQADWRILDRFHQQHILVTAAERQIGAEWVPKLGKEAFVLVDLMPNASVFQSNYLYLEAVQGFGGDESHVMLPHVDGTYVIAAPPISSLDVNRVTHVLRPRNAPSNVAGPLQPVASNERYELLAVAPGGHLSLAR